MQQNKAAGVFGYTGGWFVSITDMAVLFLLIDKKSCTSRSP